MDEAARLARKASELEDNKKWEAAAEAHRQAATAYRSVTSLDFDPVSVLSLSTLANKHTRWAEYCELQHARGITHTFSAEQISSDETKDVPGDSIHREDDTLTTTPAFNKIDDKANEHEFEDFWRYMQNWLSNPTAYTQPAIPPSTRSGTMLRPDNNADMLSPSQGFMDSFYIVESNDQGAASLNAGDSKSDAQHIASLMSGLGELDQPVGKAVANNATIDMGSPADATCKKDDDDDSNKKVSLLLDENKQLKMLVKHLNERIRTLESAAQENNMLKSSILNFREEFHRHANAVTHKIGEPADYRHLQAPLYENASKSEALIKQLQMQLESMAIDNEKQVSKITWQ
ncbi:hypothetical protein LPJ73_001796 [Coemansia sp. RSA 2703]|nr:hypothetical protein LPJ73_001796 [Coemansia sp. RSA 2703]